MKNILTIEEIKEILNNKALQNKFIEVWEEKRFYDDVVNICFSISKNNININGVKGQRLEHISVRIDGETGKMKFAGFGCQGGQFIYREIDTENEKEKYNALGHESMPAIRIKDQKRAIEKIIKDYINIIEDIEKRGLARSN